MRTLHSLILTLGITLSLSALGAPKAAPAAPKSDEKPGAAPPAAAAAAKEKKLPFAAVASSVDATGFTHKNKDGTLERFTVSEKTPVENDKAAAKWADVKPGDEIHGSRLKKADNEWEVIKITHFGPPKTKEPKAKVAPAADPKK